MHLRTGKQAVAKAAGFPTNHLGIDGLLIAGLLHCLGQQIEVFTVGGQGRTGGKGFRCAAGPEFDFHGTGRSLRRNADAVALLAVDVQVFAHSIAQGVHPQGRIYASKDLSNDGLDAAQQHFLFVARIKNIAARFNVGDDHFLPEFFGIVCQIMNLVVQSSHLRYSSMVTSIVAVMMMSPFSSMAHSPSTISTSGSHSMILSSSGSSFSCSSGSGSS